MGKVTVDFHPFIYSRRRRRRRSKLSSSILDAGADTIKHMELEIIVMWPQGDKRVLCGHSKKNSGVCALREKDNLFVVMTAGIEVKKSFKSQ
jgi:hypothetical protein